jgi:flagellar hook-length control protein FliK
MGTTPAYGDNVSPVAEPGSETLAAAVSQLGAQANVRPSVARVLRASRNMTTKTDGATALASATTSVAASPSAGTPTSSRTISTDAVERLLMGTKPAAKSQDENAGLARQDDSPSQGALRSTTTAALDSTWSAPAVRAQQAERESGAMRVGMWNQLERAVDKTVASGKNAVVIELKPPHLGDVRVTITASEQAVVAHFEAQSHMVKATLESNMYLLRDMLTQAGLKSDGLEVTVGYGGAGGQGAFGQGSRDPGAQYRAFDPNVQQRLAIASAAESVGTFLGTAARAVSAVDLLA